LGFLFFSFFVDLKLLFFSFFVDLKLLFFSFFADLKLLFFNFFADLKLLFFSLDQLLLTVGNYIFKFWEKVSLNYGSRNNLHHSDPLIFVDDYFVENLKFTKLFFGMTMLKDIIVYRQNVAHACLLLG